MTWWAPVERPGNDLPYVSFPSVLPVRFTSGPAGQRSDTMGSCHSIAALPLGLDDRRRPHFRGDPGVQGTSQDLILIPPLPASDQAVETYKSRTRPHIEFG